MKHRMLTLSAMIAAGATSTLAVQAAVAVEEARQLGANLLPWGAEKAGNKDGSIPEYKGPIAVPANYDPKRPGERPDPFANEKPLYVITARNMDQYADKLSEGSKALLKKYPTFRIDVYPTHRTAGYPKYIQDNSIKNATSCKNVDLKLEGCYGGVWFPIPKNGNEVVWNHTARYTAAGWAGTLSSNLVTPSGNVINQGIQDTWQQQPVFSPTRTGVLSPTESYWKYRHTATAPARKASEGLVIDDSLDAQRRVWQYLPGQRRVKLAPDLAYDTPSPASGGASTMDEAQVFMGAQDRFDFKLIGKKEMIIAYNNFRATDGKACPEKMRLTPNHVNPDCMRWELHRVWHVVGTVKPGIRHVYSKRDLYFDEDAPGAGISDAYDAAGKLYRHTFTYFYPMYEGQGLNADSYLVFDLVTGSWFEAGNAADFGGVRTMEPKPFTYYSAEALAGEGVR